MPLLFSYGTLRESDVQMSLFGRRLESRADELLGYEMEPIVVSDPEFARRSGSACQNILKPSLSPDSRVAGMALEVTDAELAITDGYEPEEYRRVLARLASGRDTWVYVAGSPADSRR